MNFGVDKIGRRNNYEMGALIRQSDFDSRGRITSDLIGMLDSADPNGIRTIAGRLFSWRADNALSGVEDVLAGVSVFDVDSLGRVRSVSHDRSGYQDRFGIDTKAVETYSYSNAGQLQLVSAPTYDPHVVPLARSREQVESGYQQVETDNFNITGTFVTQVGKTSYKYDALGRVVQTVQRRLSRKALVKHFTYVGSTGKVQSYYCSDMPHLKWEYIYDGLGRRVAKRCINTATNEIVENIIFGFLGDHLAVEHYTYGKAEDNTIARAWIPDPGTGEIIAQLTSTLGIDGAKQAPQQLIDVQFYALMADLTGAPKELIEMTSGNVVGHVTQSLYGQRNWKGKKCPLLFSGQYEDKETGWVYNRNRYYDPKAGCYTAQDPLGVGPNPATAQGYVKNPSTWIDYFGLKQCSVSPEQDEHGIWNKTSYNAKELRQNLKDSGQVPVAGDEAHHIVPARLNWGRAQDLRDIFHEHGVSINSAVNGEFLPGTEAKAMKGDPRLRHHGNGVHSKVEINAIYEYVRLSDSAESLTANMNNIKEFHANGILMSEVQVFADQNNIEMQTLTAEQYMAEIGKN